MRITVNLATRPFVELRPFFLRLRIAMAGLAVVAIALLVLSHVYQNKLVRQQAELNDLVAKTDTARREKSNNERRMRQPDNAGVLDRAHFLNTLFLRKSFSWTAVMMDLETVLPTGVQVTSIEPQLTPDGAVAIRLRVSGDRDRAVQLVRNLERSRRFRSPRLTGETVQAKEPGQTNAPAAAGLPAGVEFEIVADYNPLPEGEAYPHVRTVGASASATPRVVTPVTARPDSSGRYGVVLTPYGAKPAARNGGVR